MSDHGVARYVEGIEARLREAELEVRRCQETKAERDRLRTREKFFDAEVARLRALLEQHHAEMAQMADERDRLQEEIRHTLQRCDLGLDLWDVVEPLRRALEGSSDV